jgi:hypothetical protein
MAKVSPLNNGNVYVIREEGEENMKLSELKVGISRVQGHRLNNGNVYLPKPGAEEGEMFVPEASLEKPIWQEDQTPATYLLTEGLDGEKSELALSVMGMTAAEFTALTAPEPEPEPEPEDDPSGEVEDPGEGGDIPA